MKISVNWFKKGEFGTNDSSDNPDSSETITDTSSFIRQQSKQQVRPPVKSSSSG